MVRRSRGYVPASIDLPFAAPRPLLACGGQLKATFCLARGRRAWVSHHIGDLEHYPALVAYRQGIEHFERLFALRPEVIAYDLHPGYSSTAYALERDGLEATGVQHHHAHLAACLAEHGVEGPAIGAIYDGSGYGTDGTIWGGRGPRRRSHRIRALRGAPPGAHAGWRRRDPRAVAHGLLVARIGLRRELRRCRMRSRARSTRRAGVRSRASRGVRRSRRRRRAWAVSSTPWLRCAGCEAACPTKVKLQLSLRVWRRVGRRWAMSCR